MAKVIAYTVLAPGHTYPFVSVLVELQRRGFSVRLCVNTSADQAPDQMGGVPVMGIRWRPPERVPTEQGDIAAERVWLDNLARTGKPTAAALEKIMAQERPDFLLIDPVLLGAMVVAEASGLPWASLAHNPLCIRGRGIDVRGPGLHPARGLFSQLWHRVIDAGIRVRYARSLELLNSLRAGHGLGVLPDFRHGYVTAPLIIAATAEPFEYPRSDWPASLVFVGPLAWEPAGDESPWLDELDGRPLLLLTGTTVPEYRTTSTWITGVFDALANEPLQLIATLPFDEVPKRVPENVVLKRFVPHGQLLPRVKCVICHGGFGITAKALAAGIPVLAIPFELDRFEVARRVEVAGAGVMLPQRQLTTRHIRKAVRKALGCKLGAERVAESFRKAGGANSAADAIESLLGRSQSLSGRSERPSRPAQAPTVRESTSPY